SRALRLRSPRDTPLRSDTDVLLLRVGYQARTAHQEDVSTSRTNTQNDLLCMRASRQPCQPGHLPRIRPSGRSRGGVLPPPLGQLGSPEAREATVAPVPGVPVCHPYPLRALRPLRPVWPAGHRGTRSRTTRPIASGTHETLGHAGASALRMREVREPAAYAPAMGLFRSAMGLFRGRAGKDREQAAAELPNEQA